MKANQGAPGVDKVTIEEFETDLKNNLYRIWNRMSSGSYFPPPVLAVEIPKSHGDGTRVLGVPTVADRVAQTVVARRMEAKVEPIFHPDSYGYRPGRSQLDAVAACRKRCWKTDWVIDLDIQKFFDSVPWDLEMSALVDGAGRLRTWWRIMVPLVKPGLLALAVLLFVEGWNQFLLPFIFMPSGSQQTLSTLVKGILGEGRFVDYGLLTAVGLYYIAPVLVLFVLAQDQLMRIYGGGVKG